MTVCFDTGNGRIGLAIESTSSQSFYLLAGPDGSSIKLPYSPIISSKIKDVLPPKGTTVFSKLFFILINI